jgi:hypothetical protein
MKTRIMRGSVDMEDRVVEARQWVRALGWALTKRRTIETRGYRKHKSLKAGGDLLLLLQCGSGGIQR